MSFSYSKANFGALEPGSWPHWPLVADVLHSFWPGPSDLAPQAWLWFGMIKKNKVSPKCFVGDFLNLQIQKLFTHFDQWSMQKSDVFLSHVFDCLCCCQVNIPEDMSKSDRLYHVPCATMLPSLFPMFLMFLMCLIVVDVDPQTIRHFLLAPAGAIGAAERGPRWDRRHSPAFVAGKSLNLKWRVVAGKINCKSF